MEANHHPNGPLSVFVLKSCAKMRTQGNPFRARVRWIKMAQTFSKAIKDLDSFKPLMNYRLREIPMLSNPVEVSSTNKLATSFVISHPTLSTTVFSQLRAVKVTWMCIPEYTRRKLVFWDTKYKHCLELGDHTSLLRKIWESTKWAEDWAKPELVKDIHKLFSALKIDPKKEFSISLKGHIFTVNQTKERIYLVTDQIYQLKNSELFEVCDTLIWERSGIAGLLETSSDHFAIEKLDFCSLLQDMLKPSLFSGAALLLIYQPIIKKLFLDPILTCLEADDPTIKLLKQSAQNGANTIHFSLLQQLVSVSINLSKLDLNTEHVPDVKSITDMLSALYLNLNVPHAALNSPVLKKFSLSIRKAVHQHILARKDEFQRRPPPVGSVELQDFCERLHNGITACLYEYCGTTHNTKTVIKARGSILVPSGTMPAIELSVAKEAIWGNHLVSFLPEGVSMQCIKSPLAPLLFSHSRATSNLLSTIWLDTYLLTFSPLAILVSQEGSKGVYLTPVLMQGTDKHPQAKLLPMITLDEVYTSKNLQSNFLCAATSAQIITLTRQLNKTEMFLKLFHNSGEQKGFQEVAKVQMPDLEPPKFWTSFKNSSLALSIISSISLGLVYLLEQARIFIFTLSNAEIELREDIKDLQPFSKYPPQVWEITGSVFVHWISNTEKSVLYTFKRGQMKLVACTPLNLEVKLKSLDPSFIFADSKKLMAVDTSFDIAAGRTEYRTYRLRLVF